MCWRLLLRLAILMAILVGGCEPAHKPAREPQTGPSVAVAAPTASPLSVNAVVPEPNASAVLFNSAVFVQFSRPVVPLSTLDHPASDDPIEIEPPVSGGGHWINTGLYTYAPEVGWAPSTTYHLTIPRTDYSWSFTTLPAAVATTSPASHAVFIDPAAPIKVTFNQPLDPATAQLTLTPPATGQVEWSDTRTLVFRPDTPLMAGTSYHASVTLTDSTATAPYEWQFQTAPEPRVTASVPSDGAEAADLYHFELSFSAPMDPDDVRARLRVEPELDFTPYPQWTDDLNTHANFRSPLKPETDYTVTLPAGTHDRYGRTTTTDFVLRFRTPATPVSSKAPAVPAQAWLISPGPVGTFDAYAHPRALLRTTNVSHFDYSIDALDEAAVLQFYRSRLQQPIAAGRNITSGGKDVQFERNVPVLSEIDVRPLPPGYYRLHIQPTESAAQVGDHVLVITRTMLAIKESNGQAFVWARDLNTGKPVANTRVRLLQPDASGSVVEGTTDADGLAQLDIPSRSAGAQAVAVLERPGDASLALSVWNGGIAPWTFGLPFNSPNFAPPPVTAYIYTDRPIYKAGQTVHVKGIVRTDDDAHYALPETFVANWKMRDSQGHMVNSGTLSQLSDFGTFATDLELSPEAVTGTYNFILEGMDRPMASATFTVAEYQRPDFEINIAAPEQIVTGQPLSPALHAAYYFGQALGHADVHWQVSAEPFTFNWQMDSTFRFGDLDARSPRSVTSAPNAPRTEGKGSTAADGRLSFAVPSALKQDEASQRFTIEASVTDADRRQVSNRSSVVVHRAGLYLGLKPASFVTQSGRAETVELVTLDVHGQPLPGIQVHGQVLRRRWLSMRERDALGELHWISRPEDTPIGELEAQSGTDGRGSFNFTPPEGGEYRVIVEAPDNVGNLARTAISVYVAGVGYVPWRINDDNRLELQADKALYEPGDVAHVIVPAPIANATALITVERGKILSHSIKQLGSNSTVLAIPVGDEHIPNAYVSVVLFGGGKSPTLLTGYVELPVSSVERQLVVTANADRLEHSPGDTVSYTISTRSHDGQGVPAEVSLALVDAAVLALFDSHTDPIMGFWHRRPDAVSTGSSLGVSIDRMNEAASSGRKGGGGGDSASVRQDFPDVAFWSASVRTDASGLARVNIRLPDNLTTWRLTAVAITQDTRVGVASSDVVISKPLLIRPLVPRFLVGGDTATLGAAIHNTTAEPLRVNANLRADGLMLQGDAQHAVNVPAGGQVEVEWPVTSSVGEATTALLHFEAASPRARDALELKLPLSAWGRPETVATAGEVAPADTVTEQVDLPDDIDRNRGALTINVSSSLASALRYSLRQVEEYRYECLEQTVSRFLPRLALERAINQLGLGDPLNLKAELPGLVTRSIQRIYRYQHPDGGWGWWPEDTVSQPYLSSYALFGLVEARRGGFAVDQPVIDRAVKYLQQWLNGDPGDFGLETRAYVVYVLGAAGASQSSRAATLFDRRADLGPVGRAYLAQALAAIDPSDARVGGLMAELTNDAVVSATGAHWEETSSAKSWNLATDVRTTAAVLGLLVHLRPDHPLIQPTVRWLMAARRDEYGYWETTHDTAHSLLSLTDYLSESGELTGSFEWQVGVDGQTRQSGRVDSASVTSSPTSVVVPVPLLTVGANPVDFIRSVGPGRLYYTLQLQSFRRADEMPFVSQGFSVGREYLPFNGGPSAAPLSEVHVGDLVRVRLTVMAPAYLRDLLIEDPLPAGLEPLDTHLKTTSGAVAEAVRSSPPPSWQPWTHTDIRSDRVALFATYVTKGTFQYTYVARATIPGEFHVLPTNAHEQYFPEVFARGDGQRLTVLP